MVLYSPVLVLAFISWKGCGVHMARGTYRGTYGISVYVAHTVHTVQWYVWYIRYIHRWKIKQSMEVRNLSLLPPYQERTLLGQHL